MENINKGLCIDKPENISYKLALDIAGEYVFTRKSVVDKLEYEKDMFSLIDTKEIIPNCGDKNTYDKIKHNHRNYHIRVNNTRTQIKFIIRNA
jgi:hypothetical protein